MMKRRRVNSTLLITAFCLSLGAAGVMLPSPAAAQESEPTAEELEKAQAHFAKGAQFFSEQRYAAAIVEFLSAYKYKPDPMLQYNISVAHARLGNIEEAYRAALRADAASDKMPEKAVPVNAARARAWQRVLQARALGEGITAGEQLQASEEARHDDALSVIEKPADAPSSGLSALGWSGVAAGAAGVGLVGYATYVELSMSDDINAYKSAAGAPTPDAYQTYKDDLAGRQTAGLIALYSGAALTALGVGLLSYDLLREDGEERASIDVSAGAGGAALRLTYLFD